MIRLNRIFGRKTTQEHDPQGGTAPQSVFAPPGADEEWDEDLADAYLIAQEQTLANPPDPVPPLVGKVGVLLPVDPIPVINVSEDRVAMAQRQLAAAQAHSQAIPFAATQVDLSATGAELGQAGRRAGRVKTRLLGFDHAPGLMQDPIETARAAAPTARQESFPVGWIVVIRGPGRGAHFALFNGVSQIGRGDDQAIKLDFGDGSISRSNHATIAYDNETNSFFLGHGGKTNLVRLNDRPVISTEHLNPQDLIRIGETTLLFVALCTGPFRWDENRTGPSGQIGQDDFG